MVRRLSLVLLAVALFLVLWVLYLGATLRGQAMVRMWSETWVGLDCLEICGLIATAVLVIGRRSGVVVVAAMTGTLFLVDAWFDVMLSEGGVGEVLSALFGELPCAAVCFGIALTAPEWVCDRERAAALAAQRLARLRGLQRRLLSMRGQPADRQIDTNGPLDIALALFVQERDGAEEVRKLAWQSVAGEGIKRGPRPGRPPA